MKRNPLAVAILTTNDATSTITDFKFRHLERKTTSDMDVVDEF
jgi:hypothetical protein